MAVSFAAVSRLLFLLLLVASTTVAAGQLRTVPFWGLGVFGGASAYSGELTASEQMGFPSDQLASVGYAQYAVGASLSYQWHPHMGLRAFAAYGRVRGDDAESNSARALARDLAVETELFELSLQWTYDFAPSYRGIYQRPGFSPYVFGGVGGVWYRPGADINLGEINGRVDLREFRTEGQAEPYNQWALVIPFGMGARIKLAPRWDLRLELGLRKTFTDYLDDVSGATEGRGGRFPLPSELDGLTGIRTLVAYQAETLTDVFQKEDLRRGNPETDDWYAFGGIHLVYLIESRPGCPKPLKPKRRRRFLFF